MLNQLRTFFLLIAPILMSSFFCGCHSDAPPKKYELLIACQSLGAWSNPLPNEIVFLSTPSHSKECLDTILFPKVYLQRIDSDTDFKIELEIPRNRTENFFSSAEDSTSISDKLAAVKIPKSFTAPNMVLDEARITSFIKKAKIKKVFCYDPQETMSNGNLAFLNIESFSDLSRLKAAISEFVCASNLSNPKILVLYSLESINSQDEIITSLPDAISIELKKDLLQLVDTKTPNRHELAKLIWGKYFDPQAYVSRLKYKDDQSADYWNPGNGLDYLDGRLAVLESIVDFDIQSIEKSKNTGKISGLHIIEKHLGSFK